MKRILIVATIISVAISSMAMASSVDSVNVGGDNQGHKGDIKQIIINAVNVNDVDIFQLNLAYDSNVLNITNIVSGDPSIKIAAIKPGTNTVNIVVAGATGPLSGSLSLVKIDTQVIGSDNSVSSLDLTNTKAQKIDTLFGKIPKGAHDVAISNIQNSKFTVLPSNPPPPVTDTIPPVINSVKLSNISPNIDDKITVTVNATDNVKVTKVTADDTELTNANNDIWNGSITAKEGLQTVNVTAFDAAGNNVTDNSASYTGQEKPPIITSLNITGTNPDTPFTSQSNNSVTFSIETNQIANATWNLDGIQVQTNDTTPADYTNTDAKIGQHNLQVDVSNANGTNSFSWNWTVEESIIPPPINPENNNVIFGKVFNDKDKDKKLDKNEKGIKGVKIKITGKDSNGNVISQIVKTDKKGNYRFENLSAGTFKVKETLKKGFRSTTTKTQKVKLIDDNQSKKVNFGEHKK